MMLLLKEGGRTDGTRYRTDVIHYQANKNSWRFKRVGALLCSYCAPPPPPPWSVERSPLIDFQWCFKQPRSAGKQISYSEYPAGYSFFLGGGAEYRFCFMVSVYVTQSFSYTILAKKRRTQCSVAPIGWPFFVQPLEDECYRGRFLGKKHNIK